MNVYYESIKQLFQRNFGSEPDEMSVLPPSGSNRQYFRLIKGDFSVIAAHNPDRSENKAFLYITGKLKSAGVNVPQVYADNLDKNVYLLEDLGDTDLFSLVNDDHQHTGKNYLSWYKKAIDCMPAIQYQASQNFDYSFCYPRSAFDKGSMLWDLNYFKYHFLKLAYIPFHEQKLEDDFQVLADFLLEAPSDFFLYRDFQSRNIMIHNNDVHFIDYQGGRRGALQYDLASLLFEAKTSLSSLEKGELLNYYMDVFSQYSFFKKQIFLKYYPSFALIRLLQAFGAYGYRGYFERKTLFLQSIPKAIANLKWLLDTYDLGVELPHLREILLKMIDKPIFHTPEMSPNKLTVSVFSFSYKSGIPDDFSGNGGGFVFDCRALPNPGRYDQYRGLTGEDQSVKEFLEEKKEVGIFLKQVSKIVSSSIEEYKRRGFKQLMVSFGCTGGQHRSVYCAEHLYTELRSRYNIDISLFHKELQEKRYLLNNR